jgi:hypothetical protein
MGPYSAEPTVRACCGTLQPKNYILMSSVWGMAPASIINFLSNEDTQELAPGFFIFLTGMIAALLNKTAKDLIKGRRKDICEGFIRLDSSAAGYTGWIRQSGQGCPVIYYQGG